MSQTKKFLLDRTGVLRTLPKFKMVLNPNSYRMAHAMYDKDDVEHIKKYHHDPENWKDKLALGMVKATRMSFDTLTRYNPEKMDER